MRRCSTIWLALATITIIALSGCERPAFEAQAAESPLPAAGAQTAAAAANESESHVAASDENTDAPERAAPAEPAKPAEKPEPEPQPKGRAPVADRAPRRPGEAEKITFDDLIVGMQADIVFRPFMLTDRAKELEGQRVSITGYMHGGVESTKANKEFVLLRNTECKFGPGGQADHLARVFLKKGQEVNFTTKTVKAEGTLAIEPFSPSEEEGGDGNTWAIYRLDDAVLR